MGAREDNLKHIFLEAGMNLTIDRIPRLNMQDINHDSLLKEIDAVYRKLGGVLNRLPLRLIKWDVEVNNIAVELDEERHFNRYRAITLKSNIYDSLPLFPKKEYQNYCQKYEGDCLRTASFGGYWTNSSCENQFGPASMPGDLNGNGSPRWKQRAFYDYLRDITPLIIDINFARISIWDEVVINSLSIKVGEILNEASLEAANSLLDLVESRSA